MKFLVRSVAVTGVLFFCAIVTALVLVASSPPPMPKPTDVFGFASMRREAGASAMPDLKRYAARDGEQLAYRFYDSKSDRVLIFVHGSSYHGAGYHALASFISQSGAAKVVLPNMRGHYQSGLRRGDVDYIGQFEDDIADLIALLRQDGLQGPIVLGGHSSGGGFPIRFAGGAHKDMVSNYLLLSPVIPTSPAVRKGTAGGWASLHFQRLIGLLMLNTIGIHGFDALPVIAFNKPVQYWDGTETLSYSYRLNASYHPRYRYAADVRGLDGKALVLVGAQDESIDPEALRTVFAADAPRSPVTILPNVNHFGVFADPAVLQKIVDWMQGLPAPAR